MKKGDMATTNPLQVAAPNLRAGFMSDEKVEREFATYRWIGVVPIY